MPYKDVAKQKEKQREYARKYYEANKDKVIAASAKARKNQRAEFAAFKARLSCTKCGENHPATLDFHHVVPNPANKKITELLRSGRYNFAIEEIMNKCVVLCSNCHRKHHWEESKRA
jgi:5-methylcytosine-specific restriction endonuclease McrA